MLRTGFVLLLLLAPTPNETDTVEVNKRFMPAREAYQTIFYAVIEGAYRDGLSDEQLAILLKREAPASYTYFIYACPLCTPTVAALELYQSRPRQLYSLKGAGSTFGPGLPADITAKLQSTEDAQRLQGIALLQQRWMDAYLRSRNLSRAELDAWRELIDAAKEEGGRLLKRYREEGSAHLTAPAFEEEGDCAVCRGSSEGATRASGLSHFMAPDPGRTLLEDPRQATASGDSASPSTP